MSTKLRGKVTRVRLAMRSLEDLLAWESVGTPELEGAVAVEVRVVGPDGVLWRGRKDIKDDHAGN